MKLIYLGTDTASDWVAGWPAADHEDDDEERAAAKVASGLYRRDGAAGRTGRSTEASAPAGGDD